MEWARGSMSRLNELSVQMRHVVFACVNAFEQTGRTVLVPKLPSNTRNGFVAKRMPYVY